MNQKAFVVLLSAIGWMSEVRAKPVVDQHYNGSAAIAILAEGFAYAGQSVTAGRSGYLTRVELDASRRSDFTIPWVLDIDEVVAGLPTGVVLSSEIVAPGDFPISDGSQLPLAVEFMSPALLRSGQTFAIVLHPQGIEGRPGLFAGAWLGGCTSFDPLCYSGGGAFFGPSADALIPASVLGADMDLNFKTLVSPVLEPSGGVVLATGLALLLYSRRFSKQSDFQAGPA